ncbi:ParB/RepB/Spo0J family partition protein [Ralstonia pseudosolanacearum]|uniref:ParB/RepB/Spo0J family partition protein n=1 Tax=Ralstonia pseudosolanacearum TaxID=1310165 RepID=UPI003CFA2EB9
MGKNQNETQKPSNLELDFSRSFVKGNLKQGMKAVEASSSDLWMVDPRTILVIEGYNVRVQDELWEERVEELAASMMTEGFKKDSPLSVIVVREGDENKVYLKRGHTRLASVLRAIDRGAPIEAVPAIATQTDMTEEELNADLHKSNNGTPLSAYELAIVCKRQSRWNAEPAEIAKKLGIKAVSYVEDLLLLIEGPFAIRELVKTRKIAAAFAIDMLKKHGDKAQDVIETAMARAEASGSKKVSAKHVAGAVLKKAVTKAAPQMRMAINEVKADPAFGNLSEETRAKIDAIFEALKTAEKADEGMIADGSAGNGSGTGDSTTTDSESKQDAIVV